MEYGFIKKNRGGKKEKIKSKPFHYLSSDGYDMYVGKNNYQNDELTFKFATGNDWWFHAKGMPGSHVIVKSKGEEMPDRVFEEAGMLAGFYSKGRDSDKIEIDYLQKKNVKKPAGSAPGFVVYYTNLKNEFGIDLGSNGGNSIRLLGGTNNVNTSGGCLLIAARNVILHSTGVLSAEGGNGESTANQGVQLLYKLEGNSI